MKNPMDSTERNTDVLVIGAGMAGLIAAAELQRAGLRVLIIDKS
ncbi:MAG: FAD-dependent oxidoreductase, partial [Pseudomonadota bacterium]